MLEIRFQKNRERIFLKIPKLMDTPTSMVCKKPMLIKLQKKTLMCNEEASNVETLSDLPHSIESTNDQE